MATAKSPAAKPAAKSPKKPAAPKKAAATGAPAKTKAKAALVETRQALASGTETLRKEAGGFASKATDRAREYANTRKVQATGALDDVADMVESVAKTIDEKVGAQYGDYARRAASAVTGVADALKSKDVDDLVADARTFVREKPQVAIGIAAALGFVLTRLAKAGSGRDDA